MYMSYWVQALQSCHILSIFFKISLSIVCAYTHTYVQFEASVNDSYSLVLYYGFPIITEICHKTASFPRIHKHTHTYTINANMLSEDCVVIYIHFIVLTSFKSVQLQSEYFSIQLFLSSVALF